jgi:hypothetical protein
LGPHHDGVAAVLAVVLAEVPDAIKSTIPQMRANAISAAPRLRFIMRVLLFSSVVVRGFCGTTD